MKSLIAFCTASIACSVYAGTISTYVPNDARNIQIVALTDTKVVMGTKKVTNPYYPCNLELGQTDCGNEYVDAPVMAPGYLLTIAFDSKESTHDECANESCVPSEYVAKEFELKKEELPGVTLKKHSRNVELANQLFGLNISQSTKPESVAELISCERDNEGVLRDFNCREYYTYHTENVTRTTLAIIRK